MARKILIFGNSGSGKSTLAKKLSTRHGLAHLDLDTLAWHPGAPPRRRTLEESARDLDAFTRPNAGWVIEGCYADLLQHLLADANEVIFLNLSVEDCMNNARARPFESHKYASKSAQDANLDMLLAWIANYPERDDDCSLAAHQHLYQQFDGARRMVTSNQQSVD